MAKNYDKTLPFVCFYFFQYTTNILIINKTLCIFASGRQVNKVKVNFIRCFN